MLAEWRGAGDELVAFPAPATMVLPSAMKETS